MKRINFLLCIAMISAITVSMAQGDSTTGMKAVKKWESNEVFHIPESVFFDREMEVLYVSNIDGSPVVKDENGFISKLSTDGKVLDLRWVTGMNAPKGIGKHKGKLFVTDIDQLVAIDVAKGEILHKYDAEGAIFLNDIAIDKAGTVYASDLTGNAIYRFKDGKMKKWLEHDELVYPNGLCFLQGKLYVGCRDKILEIDPGSQEIKILARETGGIDGLNIDEKGNFIISDFYGKVQCITPAGEKLILFDTSFETINAADIYYEQSNHTLYVPTFRDCRIMAYDIVY